MGKFKRFKKYYVFKVSDAKAALDQSDLKYLDYMLKRIRDHREQQGKEPRKQYVVVSESMPFYGKVWRMIQEYVVLHEHFGNKEGDGGNSKG